MLKKIVAFFRKKQDIWEVYIKFDKYSEGTYIFENEDDALNFYHRYDYVLNHMYLIQERLLFKNGEPVDIIPWNFDYWYKRINNKDFNESITRFKVKEGRPKWKIDK